MSNSESHAGFARGLRAIGPCSAHGPRRAQRQPLDWGLALGIDASPTGELYLTGLFAGPLTLAGTPLAPVATIDAFLLATGSDGEPSWARAFGSLADVQGEAVVFDPSGALQVALLAGGADVELPGGRSLASRGGTDAIHARFDLTGTLRWARRIGGSGDDYLANVHVAGGRLYCGGIFRATADFFSESRSVRGTGGEAVVFAVEL